jgi:hypothetical protein
MPWNSTSPDGTKSVKDNVPLQQQNTTYTETSMNKDHFWNIGANQDGRHQFVQLPKYVSGGIPADPALGAGMDFEYYAKQKTAAEAVAQQDVQSFVRNGTAIMQLLGIRAMGVFSVAGGVLSSLYLHNCTLTRDGSGRFHADFTVALPSVNYAFLGQAFPNSTDTNAVMTCALQADTVLTNNKTVNKVIFRTVLTTGTTTVVRSLSDPIQAWFICFGG